MSNYTKSFNFRNGVQVDDSNFIVNAVGLVGIGTTKPEKQLDVRGNASITGITSLAGTVISGVMTAGNIKIDALSGVLTATKFVGDASGLTNIVAIATDGFIANSGTLSTTAKVGIGTTLVGAQLDVLGDSRFTGVTTFIGITSSIGTLFVNQFATSGISTFDGDIDANKHTVLNTLSVGGVSTFTSAVDANGGATIDNIQIGITNDNEIDTASGGLTIDSATGQTTIDDHLVVSGVVTATEFKGVSGSSVNIESGTNISGVTTFNDTVVLGAGATVGFGTTAFFPDNVKAFFGSGNDLAIYHDSVKQHSYIQDSGTGDLVILSNQVAIRNADETQDMARFYENGTVELRYQNASKFETIGAGVSVYGQLNVASLNGGTSGLSSHFGSLRYGDDSGASDFSTRNSLDLINTDSGNVNYYLNYESKPTTGDFHWHKGKTTTLMTLTGIGGSLGIGTTLPIAPLHVSGVSTFTGNSFFGNDVNIANNLTVSGNTNSTFIGDLTGDLIGNVTALSGVSTFTNIVVEGKTHTQFAGVGIGTTCATANYIETVNNAGFSTSKFIVTTDGNVAIRTDTFDNGVNISARGQKVTIGAVGIGTSAPRAAVDFSDAGKDATGTDVNRMYMYPPKITTSQRNALTGFTDGAIVFVTDFAGGPKLQVRVGSDWINLHA
tara:strand:- start:3973 stop:5973 length:2001 start_codon:yes stop_codon:yes gene_type:complete